MRTGPDVSPVFVVGAPRSGSGLLAWGLAEHPGLQLCPTEGWIGSLAGALGPVYHATVSGRVGADESTDKGGPEDFLAAFGPAIEALLHRGPPNRGDDEGSPESRDVRWIDGDPRNVFHAWAISHLLPGARFIHVVREYEAVVRHLTISQTLDAAYYTADSATEAWLRFVRAGLQAENALGPGVVQRVLHRDLVHAPEATLAGCLKFLDRPFHAACLRPIRGIRPDPSADEGRPEPVESRTTDSSPMRAMPRLRLEAQALSAALMRGEGERDAIPAPGPGATDPYFDGARARDFLAAAFLGGRSGDMGHPAESLPVERIRGMIRTGVPEGATIAVVSRGDEALVEFAGREGWHFPQTEAGVYAGHHPGSSEEAIAHLDELGRRGAEYLLIPCTAFWWLEHYEEFGRYLEDRARLVAFHEDLYILFALNPGHAPSPRRVEEIVRRAASSDMRAARKTPLANRDRGRRPGYSDGADSMQEVAEREVR